MGDGHGHVIGTFARGCPSGVPIAVIGVVGIVGLQVQFKSIDVAFHLFKLNGVGMFDIGTQHNHDGILEIGHIHLGAFVRTTDGDFRSVVFRIDNIERTSHRRSGLPLRAVASLDGFHLHRAFLTCEGQDIAFDGGRTLGNLKGHRQS